MSTHTMEYYSAPKREEILPQTTPVMTLGDTTLNEISQLQKGK